MFLALLLCLGSLLTGSAAAQVEVPAGVNARLYLQNYRAAQENAQSPTYSSISELGPGAFQRDPAVTLDGDRNFVTSEQGGDIFCRLPESLNDTLVLISCLGEVRRGKAAAALTDASRVPLRSVVADTGPGDFSGKTVLGIGKQVFLLAIHLEPNSTLKLRRVALSKRTR